MTRWLLVALLLWPVVGSGPAEADTALLGSQPGDGSTVTSRPRTVTLAFRDRILPPAQVGVFGPGGRRVDTGEPAVLGNQVQQQFSAGTNGHYTVGFRVVAEDGHPVDGQITFTVDAPVAAERDSWMSRNGAQLIGLGVVLTLVTAVAALRLRPASD